MAKYALRFTALGYLAALLVVPVGLVVQRAFADGPGDFLKAITTPEAMHALWLTILIALIAVPANTVFGVLCALAIVRRRFRGHGLVNSIVDLPLALSPVAHAVDRQRRADDLPNPLPRVERGIGVLEDDLQLAPHGAHAAAGERRDVLPVEDDAAVSQREEADEGAAEGRLAAAGFPDQAKCLALLNLEGDVVDSMDPRDLALEQDPPLDREVFDYVLRLEQWTRRGSHLRDAPVD